LEQPLYFAAFFAFAHRAFCAPAILARPAALIFRLPGLTGRICFAGPALFKKTFARSIL
jgi:hypothetical protein